MARFPVVHIPLHVRLALVILGTAAVLLTSLTVLFLREMDKVLREQLSARLASMAASTSALFHAEEFQGLKSETDFPYIRLQHILQDQRRANPDTILYTMEFRGKDATGQDEWVFVVDSTTASESIHSALYERYLTEAPVKMVEGLDHPVGDLELNSDEYGTWLSGYAPILTLKGATASLIVGVDIRAESVLLQQKRILNIGLGFLALGCGLALAVSFWLGRRISAPILQLLEGTRKVAAGELETRVNAARQDEIGDLGRSFNIMAEALVQQRENLRESARMSQELATARRIQQAMLPASAPLNRRLNIDFYLDTSTEVGGDYFDFLELSPHEIGLVIGDVTGHGVPAALLMAVIKSCLHTQVLTNHQVTEVMEIANSILYQSRFERRFMTFFYSILDTREGKLTYANAGHLYPFVYRRITGTVETLEQASYPLGVRPTLKVRPRETILDPGDVLVFYSDGLIEATNALGEEFGFERLEALLATHGHMHAEGIKGRILEEWHAYVFGDDDVQAVRHARADDDITVVVVKFVPLEKGTSPLSQDVNEVALLHGEDARS